MNPQNTVNLVRLRLTVSLSYTLCIDDAINTGVLSLLLSAVLVSELTLIDFACFCYFWDLFRESSISKVFSNFSDEEDSGGG